MRVKRVHVFVCFLLFVLLIFVALQQSLPNEVKTSELYSGQVPVDTSQVHILRLSNNSTEITYQQQTLSQNTEKLFIKQRKFLEKVDDNIMFESGRMNFWRHAVHGRKSKDDVFFRVVSTKGKTNSNWVIDYLLGEGESLNNYESIIRYPIYFEILLIERSQRITSLTNNLSFRYFTMTRQLSSDF